MAGDDVTCDSFAVVAQTALFIMYASHGRIQTAKKRLFELPVCSYLSRHMRI